MRPHLGDPPVFGVRHPLQPADLLRGPADDLEHRLVAGASARRQVVASGLAPRPSDAGPLDLPGLPGRDELLLQVQTATRTGAPVLSVAPPEAADGSTTPAPADGRTMTGGATLRRDLEQGWTVRADGAGVWMPALGRAIDALVAGWQVQVGARLVLSLAERADDPTDGDRIVIDAGPGTATYVPAGATAAPMTSGDGIAVRVELDLRDLRMSDLTAQLVRTAGLDPLLRADLPIGVPRSYAGSLADQPGTLWERVRTLVDDQLVSATAAWWAASLTYAPSTVRISAPGSVPAIPGGPSFLDHRLPQPVDGRRVLAFGGHLLMFSPEDVEALVRWLEDGDVPDPSTDLMGAFAELDLCRPPT